MIGSIGSYFHYMYRIHFESNVFSSYYANSNVLLFFFCLFLLFIIVDSTFYSKHRSIFFFLFNSRLRRIFISSSRFIFAFRWCNELARINCRGNRAIYKFLPRSFLVVWNLSIRSFLNFYDECSKHAWNALRFLSSGENYPFDSKSMNREIERNKISSK